MHTLHKLVKHDLVKRLPQYNYENDRVCRAYIRGKQVHASIKPLKCVSTSKYLESLDMNLCEPTRIRSLGGSIYILIIAHDYPRFT